MLQLSKSSDSRLIKRTEYIPPQALFGVEKRWETIIVYIQEKELNVWSLAWLLSNSALEYNDYVEHINKLTETIWEWSKLTEQDFVNTFYYFTN